MTPRRPQPPRAVAIPTIVAALLFSASSVAHFLSWGIPGTVDAVSASAGGFAVGSAVITIWWTWWSRRRQG